MGFAGIGQDMVGHLMGYLSIGQDRVGQGGIYRDRTGQGRTRWNMPG